MEITKEKVVAIHYTLSDNDGNVLDTSDGRDPLHYIQGLGNLIPGLEEKLEGKTKGEKLDVKVAPEKGYGQRDEKLVQSVPKTAFGEQEIKEGMQFHAGTTEENKVLVTVTNVGPENVTVDGNHPLAGVELNFAVEIMEVRKATSEELDHGHVHGPGGHHH